MIKLDNSIWDDIQSDDQQAYWNDFDNNGYTFAMEVNDSLQDDINDLLNMIGDDI